MDNDDPLEERLIGVFRSDDPVDTAAALDTTVRRGRSRRARRRIALSATVVVVIVAGATVAYSNASPGRIKVEQPAETTTTPPPPSSTTTSRTAPETTVTTVTTTVTTVPAPVVTVATTPPATIPPPPTFPPNSATACTHDPTKFVDNSYYGLPTPAGATPIDYRQFSVNGANGFTNDRRGYTVSAVGSTILRSGPDGTMTLQSSSPNGGPILRGTGDYDGDGRTDLLVDDLSYSTFIVKGSVGPGTYDLAAVGVPIPHPALAPGAFEAFPETVGDQDVDGTDDISFGQQIYSGRQLSALAPGAPLPPPIRTLPSLYLGLLEIDANRPPVFVVFDPTAASLRVLDAHSDRLHLDADPANVSAACRLGTVTGWNVNGQLIVQLSYGERDGTTAWRWHLEAPCGT